jgi:hypothetical protein
MGSPVTGSTSPFVSTCWRGSQSLTAIGKQPQRHTRFGFGREEGFAQRVGGVRLLERDAATSTVSFGSGSPLSEILSEVGTHVTRGYL